MAELLNVKGLSAGYGPVAVLHDVDLRISQGEMVALIGSNGAGKSTLMRALSGIADVTSGTITLDGRPLQDLPARLRLNEWALAGDWTMKNEAAALNAPDGRLAYRFHARDLHLVMGPVRQERPSGFAC